MKAKRMLEKIEGDFTSGSNQLAIIAAEALMIYLQEKQKDWRRDLPEFCSELVESKPAMASLYNVANQALLESKRKSTTKKALKDLLQGFKSALKDSVRKIGKNGVSLISKNSVLFTHSRSASVFSVIEEGVKAEKIREVVVTQSYPLGEGITFSREIEELGVETKLIPDSAMGSAIPICDCVLIGADAITEEFLVNKVGSLLLALSAQHLRKPFYCAVDTLKFVPSRVYNKWTDRPLPIGRQAPTRLASRAKRAGEAGKNVRLTTEGTDPPSPQGLRRAGRNVYPTIGLFEAVPLSLVTQIITEDGVMDPQGVKKSLKNVKTAL
jgi:translation initiation factor 2B subunit (eIF-2B alpha/beta/delta family)